MVSPRTLTAGSLNPTFQKSTNASGKDKSKQNASRRKKKQDTKKLYKFTKGKESKIITRVSRISVCQSKGIWTRKRPTKNQLTRYNRPPPMPPKTWSQKKNQNTEKTTTELLQSGPTAATHAIWTLGNKYYLSTLEKPSLTLLFWCFQSAKSFST